MRSAWSDPSNSIAAAAAAIHISDVDRVPKTQVSGFGKSKYMYRTSGSRLFYFSWLIMKVLRNFPNKSSNMQSKLSKATFNSNFQYLTRVLDTWSWSSLADIQVMFFIGLERDQFHVWLIMRRRLSRRLSPPPHKEITALIIKVSEKLHLLQTQGDISRPVSRNWGATTSASPGT